MTTAVAVAALWRTIPADNRREVFRGLVELFGAIVTAGAAAATPEANERTDARRQDRRGPCQGPPRAADRRASRKPGAGLSFGFTGRPGWIFRQTVFFTKVASNGSTGRRAKVFHAVESMRGIFDGEQFAGESALTTVQEMTKPPADRDFHKTGKTARLKRKAMAEAIAKRKQTTKPTKAGGPSAPILVDNMKELRKTLQGKESKGSAAITAILADMGEMQRSGVSAREARVTSRCAKPTATGGPTRGIFATG